MHFKAMLYVLAGVAGVRYVERRERVFRTIRRIRSPIAMPSLLLYGGLPEANYSRNVLVPALEASSANGHMDGYDTVILVAPAIALPALLSSLSTGTRSKVIACIERDLSRIRDQEISRYLPLHLVYQSRLPDLTRKQV